MKYLLFYILGVNRSVEYTWLFIGFLAALFVAWNNGSNNAANAIGTVVGARALNLKHALYLAAFFDFLGAILFGGFVSKTIMKGIVDVSLINDQTIIIRGMVAALLATGFWVLFASWIKIPMSISEGIVGGVIGFGLVALGPRSVNWSTVSIIISSWIILPLFSAVLALILYLVYERMFGKESLVPYVAVSSLFLMVFSTLFLLMVKTLKLNDIARVVFISTMAGLVASSLFAVLYFSKISKSDKKSYIMIKVLLLVAAASMAFSHGANDVANSAGPLSAILYVYQYGEVPKIVGVSPIALVVSAIGIAFGILSWGHRVVETIGEKITTLTYSSAFTAQLSASLSVLIITRLGLPVSTTIAIVGAVAGVGMAKGFKAVDKKTLARIISTWIIALPAVIVMSMLIYVLLSII